MRLTKSAAPTLAALPIPPPPWIVRGSALVVLGHLSRGRARALAAQPRGFMAPPLLGSLGVLGLIHYDDTPVGPYNELALMPGVLWRQMLPGMLISHMLVDNARSRMAGRALWGLPKELARFAWTDQQIAVTTPTGTPLLTAARRTPAGSSRARPHAARPPLPNLHDGWLGCRGPSRPRHARHSTRQPVCLPRHPGARPLPRVAYRPLPPQNLDGMGSVVVCPWRQGILRKDTKRSARAIPPTSA